MIPSPPKENVGIPKVVSPWVTRADPKEGCGKVWPNLFFQRARRFSTATPLLLAIPRVFLPDDDLFLTYTSLGTRPRGHSTSLELEITSSWKPIFRGPTEMSWGGKGWRGEHVAGKNEKYRLSPPSLSFSLWRQLWFTIFMESCYRAGKQQEERSSANEIKTQSRDF